MNNLKDSNPEERLAKDKNNQQKSGDLKIWIVFVLGFYFFILSFLFLFIIIKVWSVSDSEKLLIVLGNFLKVNIGSELKLIFIVVSTGALGSLIHSMTSFATYIGNRQFAKSWISWFILRPFIGMPLALIFYFVIRGGLFTLSANEEAVSSFGIAGLSGLVGMFSKQAIDKLREVFENFFKTAESDQRTDKLKG